MCKAPLPKNYNSGIIPRQKAARNKKPFKGLAASKALVKAANDIPHGEKTTKNAIRSMFNGCYWCGS
jgi:hypothetical protein